MRNLHRNFLYTIFVLTSADRPIHIERMHYGIPCARGRLWGESTNDRCFHLLTSSTEVLLRGARQQDYNRDILLTSPHTARDRLPIRINRSNAQIPENWRQYTDDLGIGFGSDFGNLVGSMMMLPHNPDQFDAEISVLTNVQDPASNCLDRELSLVNLIPQSVSKVEISVSVLSSGESVALILDSQSHRALTHIYSIDTSEYTRVPMEVWNVVRQYWERRSIRHHSPQELESGCASIIPQMPTLRFSIRNNGVHATDINMFGRDYISVDQATGRCRIHIQGIEDPDTSFSLGMSVIERIGLFFDYRNNQIGFCEPV